MRRAIAILLGLGLLGGMGTVFARDGGHRGGGAVAGRHSGHGGGFSGVRPGSVAPGYQGVRPTGHPGYQGVRPIVSVHPRPGVVSGHHHHNHHRRRAFVGTTVIFGAPLFYNPPFYVAPAPVYTAPPVYVEQASQIYYYCPDYRDYYPNVATCPSPWLQVLPEASVTPN